MDFQVATASIWALSALFIIMLAIIVYFTIFFMIFWIIGMLLAQLYNAIFRIIRFRQHGRFN